VAEWPRRVAWRSRRGGPVPGSSQRADLAEDIAAALDANPTTAAFFDSLVQFCRRAYLRWTSKLRAVCALCAPGSAGQQADGVTVAGVEDLAAVGARRAFV
jgi:hypothetical protein